VREKKGLSQLFLGKIFKEQCPDRLHESPQKKTNFNYFHVKLMYLEILLKWSQKLRDGGVTILIKSHEFALDMRCTFACFKSVKLIHIHWFCFLRNRREGNKMPTEVIMETEGPSVQRRKPASTI
jgi:hypothetical protein